MSQVWEYCFILLNSITFFLLITYMQDHYGHVTDQAWPISNNYDMRLGGAQFESWPVHQLFVLITYIAALLVVFLNSSRQMLR
jgi:hypothetical protein